MIDSAISLIGVYTENGSANWIVDLMQLFHILQMAHCSPGEERIIFRVDILDSSSDYTWITIKHRCSVSA